MVISGGSDKGESKSGTELSTVIGDLRKDFQRLSALRLLSAEETDAMAAFIREMSELQERLESGPDATGLLMSGGLGRLELEGMIRILRDDIGLVRMRNAA